MTDFMNPEVARNFSATDSPYAYYARVFEMPDRASTILDLGCGSTALFGRSPENRQHTVISVSPHLAALAARTHLRANNEFSSVIAANAQHLPFRGGLFDLILSSYAVPTYVPDNERHQAFQESIRVLKPGGNAQFFPYVAAPGDQLSALEDQATISFNQVDDALAYRSSNPFLAQLLDDILPRQQMTRLTLTKNP